LIAYPLNQAVRLPPPVRRNILDTLQCMSIDNKTSSATGPGKAIPPALVGLGLVWAAYELGFTWLGLPAALLLLVALSLFTLAYGTWSPENKAQQDRQAAQAEFVRTKEKEEAKRTSEALKAKKARQQKFLEEVKSAAGHEPVIGSVLSRGRHPFQKGSAVLLTCRARSLHLSSVLECSDLAIDFKSITKLEISGPGKTVSGGGTVGGGFGVEAAAEGILIASVLNALTTKTKNETYLTVQSGGSEVLIHVAKLTPLELRVLLSPAILATDENARAANLRPVAAISEEIERLAKLHRDGVLTHEEFARAKASLLRSD
jgi:hypothetical protein